jgi:hypothetical protein
MADFNDYLQWRGDLTLDQDKFNEVDILILARFSYLPFNKIEMKQVETIEDISDKMKKFKEKDFGYHGDKEMISLLGGSRRFRKMEVTDFVEKNDLENQEQFSAVTIHMPNDIMFISFDGTNNSIVGWKEDFNMSFMENVPSQLRGKAYLKQIAEKYPNKKMYVGGHSKGGNVAVYSAIYNNKEVQDRIIKIINCDGPGFDRNVVDRPEYKRIVDKVFTFIPQDSVIGRLMEHEEKYDVIKSTAKGIYQHDIHSWQVTRNRIIRVDCPTKHSEFVNESLHQYLKDTTPEQREFFVGAVYDIIQSTNVDTFDEFHKAGLKKVPKIIKSYKKLSPEERKLMTAMFAEFFKSAWEIIKKGKKTQDSPVEAMAE